MPAPSVPPAAELVPRLQVRDPDGWLRLAAFAIVGFSALQILLFAFGRDQGIYALVGEGLLHGKLPYRDLWDFKPPGIFFVYALAQAAFGKSMLAPRLLEVLGLFALVACSGRLAQTFFGNKTVGYVGGAIAALIHAELEFWHTGQPETFGGFVTVFALVLATEEGKRSRRFARWAAVGLAFGCAALLKPPLGGGALVCAAYLARREQQSSDALRARLLPVLAVGCGFLLPIGALALWFWARGGLPALYWTMHDFTPGYTALGWAGRSAPAMFYYALQEAFFKFSAVAAAGVIAAIAISPMHQREREGLFVVLGVIALHVTGIAMQGKFFPYHYAATLPLIAFIGGLGFYKLWRRCLGGGAGGVMAYALFALACVAMRQAVGDLPQDFWDRSALRMKYLFRLTPFAGREALDAELASVADVNLSADRAVALEVRAHTRGDAPVFVWGFEPVIYWLAARPPATRFIYDVPQRTPWQRGYARAELMRELRARPPAAIVVQRNDVFPMVTGDTLDSHRALATFPELATLIDEQYELASTIEDFELFLKHR
jgi:hypothetical protein